jgi:hypothetical protein
MDAPLPNGLPQIGEHAIFRVTPNTNGGPSIQTDFSSDVQPYTPIIRDVQDIHMARSNKNQVLVYDILWGQM